MKKYQTSNTLDRNESAQQELGQLRVFQYLLRNSERLNERYHNKAREIADGIQPWIDALEIDLRK